MRHKASDGDGVVIRLGDSPMEAQITIDGHDITAFVRGVTFRSSVDEISSATLDIVGPRLEFAGEADVSARIVRKLIDDSEEGVA